MVRFKIDTGPYVTVILEPVYLEAGQGRLQKASRDLFGPDHSKPSVKGVAKETSRPESQRNHAGNLRGGKPERAVAWTTSY